MSISPDGKTLATGSWDSNGFWRGLVPDTLLGAPATVVLWDIATGNPRATLAGHKHNIGTLAWSPDGKLLATGAWDGSVIIWDTIDGSPLTSLTDFSEVVSTVAWSPDGKTLATTFGSFNKSTILWSITRSSDGSESN